MKWILFCVLILLNGCAVLRNKDGEVKCSIKGFARDLSYEVETRETILLPEYLYTYNGITTTAKNAKIEYYKREKSGGSSTVADVLGASAKVLGAASSLSPF